MNKLQQVVYLSIEQYAELKTNGTITVGDVTIAYDPDVLYIVPDAGTSNDGLYEAIVMDITSGKVVAKNALEAQYALEATKALQDADGNVIHETYTTKEDFSKAALQHDADIAVNREAVENAQSTAVDALAKAEAAQEAADGHSPKLYRHIFVLEQVTFDVSQLRKNDGSNFKEDGGWVRFEIISSSERYNYADLPNLIKKMVPTNGALAYSYKSGTHGYLAPIACITSTPRSGTYNSHPSITFEAVVDAKDNNVYSVNDYGSCDITVWFVTYDDLDEFIKDLGPDAMNDSLNNTFFSNYSVIPLT